MSVFQLPDGRWVCNYPKGRNPDAPDRQRTYFGRGPEAEAAARALNKALGLGRRRPPRLSPTLADLADRYMEASTARQASWEKTYNKLQSKILPAIGAIMAHNITHDILDRYKKERMAQVSVATVRGELSIIRTVLRWAVKRKYIPYNPIDGYRLPAPEYQVIRPPSDAEFNAILEHAPPHLARAMLISYHTGLRPGQEELFALTWDAVDFHARTITIKSAHKGGLPVRIVPLNKTIYRHLVAWYDQDASKGISHLVNYRGRRVSRIQRAWNSAKKKARITRRLRLYDIRHKAISDMLSAGADLKSVSEIVGHSTPDLTIKIYQHINTEQKKSAVNMLSTDTEDDEKNIK